MVRDLTLPWAVACLWLGSGEWDQAGDTWKDLPVRLAKDVQSKSNEVQNTRTDLRACHTLHKHWSYSAADKLRGRLLFFWGWQSEELDKCCDWNAILAGRWSERHRPIQKQIDNVFVFYPPFILATISFASVSPRGTLFPRLCALYKSELL